MEGVRNRARLEFITKHEDEKFLKQQSEPNFNGFHKAYGK